MSNISFHKRSFADLDALALGLGDPSLQERADELRAQLGSSGLQAAPDEFNWRTLKGATPDQALALNIKQEWERSYGADVGVWPVNLQRALETIEAGIGFANFGQNLTAALQNLRLEDITYPAFEAGVNIIRSSSLQAAQTWRTLKGATPKQNDLIPDSAARAGLHFISSPFTLVAPIWVGGIMGRTATAGVARAGQVLGLAEDAIAALGTTIGLTVESAGFVGASDVVAKLALPESGRASSATTFLSETFSATLFFGGLRVFGWAGRVAQGVLPRTELGIALAKLTGHTTSVLGLASTEELQEGVGNIVAASSVGHPRESGDLVHSDSRDSRLRGNDKDLTTTYYEKLWRALFLHTTLHAVNGVVNVNGVTSEANAVRQRADELLRSLDYVAQDFSPAKIGRSEDLRYISGRVIPAILRMTGADKVNGAGGVDEAGEELNSDELGRMLGEAWFHLEIKERNAITEAADKAVKEIASAPDMGGFEALKKLYEIEDRVELPALDDIVTPRSADITAIELSEALRDRLILRLRFLLKDLPAEEALSLRDNVQRRLTAALDGESSGETGKEPAAVKTASKEKEPAVIVKGRPISGVEATQARQLAKWLREIRPLMDKFNKLRGDRPRLSEYDIEGMIPSQKKAFRRAGANIVAYLEAVRQRPPEEQYRILNAAVRMLGKPLEERKSLSAAAVSAQPFVMVSSGGAEAAWSIGEVKKVLEGLNLLRSKMARTPRNEYTIENVTIDGGRYHVIGKKTVASAPARVVPPWMKPGDVAQGFSPAGSIGRTKVLRYTPPTAPRRFDGPPPDPLLAMPGPEERTRPLEAISARIGAASEKWAGGKRPFGIDGAGDHLKLPPAGFESDSHASELWGYLKKKGYMPSRFAYAGGPARAWLALQDLRSNGRYKPVGQTPHIEAGLIAQQAGGKAILLWDAGVGNGDHSIELIKELGTAGVSVERYTGVDFSEVLLRFVGGRLQNELPDLRCGEPINWNLEQGPMDLKLDPNNKQPAVFALVGQTLGNVDDPKRVLKNLHASARQGDLLVVGVALKRDGRTPADHLRPYLEAGDVFAEASVSPLRYLGAEKSKTGFVMRFDEAAQTVIGSLKFEEDVTLKYKDDPLHFKKGDEVVVFTSHRFGRDEMIELFKENGWTFLDAAYDDDGTNGVFIATRGDILPPLPLSDGGERRGAGRKPFGIDGANDADDLPEKEYSWKKPLIEDKRLAAVLREYWKKYGTLNLRDIVQTLREINPHITRRWIVERVRSAAVMRPGSPLIKFAKPLGVKRIKVVMPDDAELAGKIEEFGGNIARAVLWYKINRGVTDTQILYRKITEASSAASALHRYQHMIIMGAECGRLRVSRRFSARRVPIELADPTHEEMRGMARQLEGQEVYIESVEVKGLREGGENVMVIVKARRGNEPRATVGYGEAAPLTGAEGGTREQLMADIGGARLAGRRMNLAELERLMAKRMRYPAARAGVEMAVLGAVSNRERRPLASFINPKVVMGDLVTDAAIPMVGAAQARELAARYEKEGFHRIKVEVGDNIAMSARRVEAVWGAFERAGRGNELELIIDANGGYTPKGAISLLRMLNERGIVPAVFEQPVKRMNFAGANLAGLRRVRSEANEFGTRIFADESVHSIEEARLVIEGRAADGIVLKLMKHGGILPALRIAALAKEHGLGLMIGGMSETRLGLSAAAHLTLAVGGPDTWLDLGASQFLDEGVLSGGVRYAGPRVALPKVNGIGVNLVKGGARPSAPTAPGRHEAPPPERMPGPDGSRPLEATSARIGAASEKWAGGKRPFGIDGANGVKDAQGAREVDDKERVGEMLDRFLQEAWAAKSAVVAATPVETQGVHEIPASAGMTTPRDGFELRYDRANDTVIARVSPDLLLNTARGIFKRFIRSLRFFSYEHPFIPAVAVEIGEGRQPADSLSAKTFLDKALEFAEGWHMTSAVFAARCAYALTPDRPEVLDTLSYVLLRQALESKSRVKNVVGERLEERQGALLAHFDTIIQNLAEAEGLVARWQKIEPESELARERTADIARQKDVHSHYFNGIVKRLWGEYGTPPHARFPLLIEILRRVYEIDPHPFTASRLATLHTISGRGSLKQGRYGEAEMRFREALKYESGNASVASSLAVTLRRQGRPQEALKFVESFMAGNEDAQRDPYLNLELANIHLAFDDLQTAEGILKGSLQWAGGNEDAFYRVRLQLAYVKQRMKKFSEAEGIYQRLPYDDRVAYERGHLYRLMAIHMPRGDPRSIAVLEQALGHLRYAYRNMRPDNPHRNKRKGVLLEALRFAEGECRVAGREEEAQRYSDEARQLELRAVYEPRPSEAEARGDAPPPEAGEPERALSGVDERIEAAGDKWTAKGRAPEAGRAGRVNGGKGGNRTSEILDLHLLVTGITDHSSTEKFRAAADQVVGLLKVLDMNTPPADWSANLIIANAIVEAFSHIAEMEPPLRRRIIAHISALWKEMDTLQKRLNHADTLKQAMDEGYKGLHWKFRLGLYNGKATDVKREERHPEAAQRVAQDFVAQDFSPANVGRAKALRYTMQEKEKPKKKEKEATVPGGYEHLFGELMRRSPEFLRMYQEDPQKVFKAFSSDFGGDIGRRRVAREHLPWLMKGRIGGNGGAEEKDVLFAIQQALPFLRSGERQELEDLVHAVRLILYGRLTTDWDASHSRLQALDTVAHSLPETLAKIVVTIPRELTGELHPRFLTITVNGLVRYLFNKTVLKDEDPQF